VEGSELLKLGVYMEHGRSHGKLGGKYFLLVPFQMAGIWILGGRLKLGGEQTVCLLSQEKNEK
jgi:hypothetical protein